MASAPTIRDVATEAGVSLGTVSRVMNGHKHVTPTTMQKVYNAMDRLRYRPNAVAQSMRTKETHVVAFTISDICNPIFGPVIKAAEEVLYGAGYVLVLASSDDHPSREGELLTVFQHRQVDGLIMGVSDESNPALRRVLHELSIPVVLLEREIPVPADAVLADHRKGMYQATDHLLRLGHRRIALITASPLILPGRERVQGFSEAHRAMHLKPEPALIRNGGLSADYGFRESYSLLTMEQPPTAIIAGGNQILAGVLKAIGMLGIKIPTNLSLISCDDTDLSALYAPPITVIDRNLEEIGRTAAELLLHRLRSRNRPDPQPRRIVLPTQMVLRDSCAPPLGQAEAIIGFGT